MAKIYESDTIAAIATPMGEGGIGIVRLSGPLCPEIAGRVFKRKAAGPWESHRLYYGHVVDPETGRGRHRPDPGKDIGRTGCRIGTINRKALQCAHGGKEEPLVRSCSS